MSTSANTSPSPCIDVCRMNERTGWCEGCFRTIDEIAAWSTLTEAEKRDVWSQLLARSTLAAEPRRS